MRNGSIFVAFAPFLVIDPYAGDSPITVIVTMTYGKLTRVDIFHEKFTD